MESLLRHTHMADRLAETGLWGTGFQNNKDRNCANFYHLVQTFHISDVDVGCAPSNTKERIVSKEEQNAYFSLQESISPSSTYGGASGF